MLMMIWMKKKIVILVKIQILTTMYKKSIVLWMVVFGNKINELFVIGNKIDQLYGRI
jgi:hypothetical protein